METLGLNRFIVRSLCHELKPLKTDYFTARLFFGGGTIERMKASLAARPVWFSQTPI
jgi:hypothetical protein